MDSTRLDQKPPGYFLGLFDPERIRFRHRNVRPGDPSRSDEWTHDGEFRIEGGDYPFSFNIRFPATEAGVHPKYIEVAKAVLKDIGELDTIARQPIDEENAKALAEQGADLDRDVYLASVNIEPERLRLHYFWDTCNAEFGAVFKRKNDGTWDFVDIW